MQKKEEADKSVKNKKDIPDDRMRMTKQMREMLLAAIKNDEQFVFLCEKYSDEIDLLENSNN